MGNSCCVSWPTEQKVDSPSTKLNSNWKRRYSKREALKVYVEDGTLLANCSDGLLELRAFIDDHVLLRGLAEYAQERNMLVTLMCWVELLEFKDINEMAIESQIGKGLHIYHKYVKNTCAASPSQIYASDEVRMRLGNTLAEAQKAGAALSAHLFDEFLHSCLEQMYNSLYVPYKETESFLAYSKLARQSYNKVCVDDFEFFEELGQGGFGLVVHCKKKSTGKHYALKIQTKFGLLECFSDNPARVMLEREAATHCHHNFIASMDYAFQSESLTFMVVDLGTCGTLDDALSRCDNRMMPEERVVFYSAEIILALSHIHRLGMIYRDLKPSNVLVCEDGHIKLVDLGSVVDVGGKVFGSSEKATGLLENDSDRVRAASISSFKVTAAPMNAPPSVVPCQSSSLFAPAFVSSPNSRNSSTRELQTAVQVSTTGAGFTAAKGRSISPNVQTFGHMNSLLRANSVMGTRGFMAPEMMIITQENQSEGYTCSVDYWSLGVMMYKLLTSKLPFHYGIVASFMEYTPKTTYEAGIAGMSMLSESPEMPAGPGSLAPIDVHFYAPHVTKHPALLAAFAKLDALKCVSTSCKATIAHFLEVDENKRLGSGPGGLREIKTQRMFRGLDWSKLSQKHVVPPFIPQPFGIPNMQPYDSFDDMLASCGKARWLHQTIRSVDKIYFENWDWISPSILKAEMGVEEKLLCETSFIGIDMPSSSSSVRRNYGSGGLFGTSMGSSHCASGTHSYNESRKRTSTQQTKELIHAVLQRQLSSEYTPDF